MFIQLASKIGCQFVSNSQRYNTLSVHVPEPVLQFASEKKRQYIGVAIK